MTERPRSINRVMISGDVEDRIHYGSTPSSTSACSFYLLAHTPPFSDTRVKINCYGAGLVNVCKRFLSVGSHVLIEGELLNRQDREGSVEVRAHRIIFYNLNEEEDDSASKPT